MPMSRRPTVTVLLLGNESRTVYAQALRAAGFAVVEAGSEADALSMVGGARPAVILICFDADTRDDRLRFCRTVKADAQARNTPMLLLTAAAASGDDVELATDPGVMVLSVPADAETKLVAAVQGVMAAQRPEPLRAALPESREKRRTS
jgi:CheY-like chemotaxis protein